MTTVSPAFPRPDSQDGLRPLPFHEADLRCRRLTGLPLKRASITIGRLLNAYLHSLPDVDPKLRAALPPLRDCKPRQLQETMTLLLNRHPTQPGPARWATHLLTNLAPLLDWNLVLAHARFPDPTVPARTSETA